MNMRNWLTVGLLALGACANCPCTQQSDCTVDEDCGPSQVCRDDKCEDAPRACITDDECDADRACIDGLCEIGSRNTVDAGADAGYVVECVFGAKSCTDGHTARLCSLGRWNTVDCSRNGLVCEEGGCVPAPCGTQATRCVDLGTVETCATGALDDCASNQMCWAGRCAKSTGEPCATDLECAGGACHCPGDGGCVDRIVGGYCTQRGCNSADGGSCPTGDQCMALASAGAARVNLCGATVATDCPESMRGQAASYNGPFKRYIPVPGAGDQYTFGDPVCFGPVPKDVGAPCTTATECLGGAPGNFAGQCQSWGGGYCTHACDNTHPCSPQEACVHRSTDPAGAGICVMGCSHPRQGLVECNRAGLSCQQSGGAFMVLDGTVDLLGFCLGT